VEDSKKKKQSCRGYGGIYIARIWWVIMRMNLVEFIGVVGDLIGA
jgi:hypothetical protein